MDNSLKDKTLSGIVWSLLQNVGGRGIQFLVMLLLARLLVPEDFGLVGMLMIFIQISQTLVNAGFNQALIQKKEVDHEDYSSVFWINLVVSAILYLILFFCAPLIARFYEQEILTVLCRGFAVVFLINAFSYVQEARLTREMKFKTLTLVGLPSTIFGGLVGIGMALMNYGVWSIIGLQIATRAAYAVQIWIYSKWKPLYTFNIEKAKTLFKFGGNLMASSLINTIFKNIYSVVIGKYFPLNALGYYQHSDNLVRYPKVTIVGAINKVVFSSLSKVQNDDKQLKRGYKKMIKLLFYLMCPLFMFTAIFAAPLFEIVFTEKWLPAVPYFQLLCIVGIMSPLNFVNLMIVQVKGRTDIYLKLEILKKAIVVLGIVIAIPNGVFALIILRVVCSFINYILNSFYTGKFIAYPVPEQVMDIVPNFILTVVVGLISFSVIYFLDSNTAIVNLVMGLSLSTLIYLLLSHFLQMSQYTDFKDIFTKVFRTSNLKYENKS